MEGAAQDVQELLAEAAALKQCAQLISSLGQRVASCAHSVHVMGENADASGRMLKGWAELFVPGTGASAVATEGRRGTETDDKRPNAKAGKRKRERRAEARGVSPAVGREDEEAFEDDLEEWERQIDEYERDAREEFPESHKKAILMHNAPGQIKKHLYLNSSRMTSFAVVKHEVIQFLRAERAFSNPQRNKPPTGDGAPMEIDEIKGGKKGKGKKGGGEKGNGGGKSTEASRGVDPQREGGCNSA